MKRQPHYIAEGMHYNTRNDPLRRKEDTCSKLPEECSVCEFHSRLQINAHQEGSELYRLLNRKVTNDCVTGGSQRVSGAICRNLVSTSKPGTIVLIVCLAKIRQFGALNYNVPQ